MVTINQIDELLNTKLAKLENNILKQLDDSNASVSKKFPEKNSKILFEDSVIVQKPTDKTFEVECMELVKQCTEWWCPVHSDFKALVKLVKPTSYEDQLIIKRAKSRFAYWSKGNPVRCCTSDRKRSVAPKLYDIPSCWPTSMPGDIEKMTDNFNNLNC
ncbi:unnamed protein product [Macrosiphum euphorbiae]|uniref:Uncharacterized protein n=1 Tax=Macrosiphum euphorbiae TaxID=13131 RepID=A0AAV0Y687_9HEMI|nr:unnamed protein product [Macrosiphum euphorbiae]